MRDVGAETGTSAETSSSELATSAAEPSSSQLAGSLAAIVASTSGVLRIEPTLRGTVTAWRRGGDDDPAQHLRVTLRNRVVDVDVSLAVAAELEARLLGHRLRDRLQDHLVGQGLVPGSIEISILLIEPTV